MQLSDDPIRLAPPATQTEIDGRARAVAAIIRSVATGPMTDIYVCVKAARELGATVIKGRTSGDDPGLYDPKTARIIYDPRSDETECCRRIIHELAHHVQATYRIGAIRRGVERYNDNRETLQHRIARRVEEILLG